MNISKSDMLSKNNIKFSESNGNSSFNIKPKNDKKEEQNGSVVFAGKLNIMQNQNAIASKQVEAQKKAIKSVMDQYKNDAKVDKGIANRQEHQAQLTNDAKVYLQEIDNINSAQNKLKDTYGVTDDSDEEKNLNLLRKSMNLAPDEKLSDDEMEQLKNIGPLTDYQKSSLAYDGVKDLFEKKIEEANQGIANENQAITGTKLALLKTHPMVDAQKEAAEIMEKACKDVISTLLSQAKDSVDDKIEKNKEEAEAKKEEEDKKKEAEAKAKAENEKTDAVNNKEQDTSQVTTQTGENKAMNQVQEAGTDQADLQVEAKNVINKLKILDEDVKGIAVDAKL